MQIEISDDEALVLFELLFSYGDSDDDRRLVLRHAAERNALWALSAQLEKVLVAPFQKDYQEVLSAARTRIEEQGGTW
jgi:hypothetical protein